MKRTPLKRVNRKRMKQRTEDAFGPHAEHIRQLPCCVCGSGPSTAHHTMSRGAGGLAKDLVPLCGPCHRAVHYQGQYTFDAMCKINLRAIAAELWAQKEL